MTIQPKSATSWQPLAVPGAGFRHLSARAPLAQPKTAEDLACARFRDPAPFCAMSLGMVRSILLVLTLAVVAAPAPARDLDIVISRNDTTATLYIRSTLSLLPPVFGVDLLADGTPTSTTALPAQALLANTAIQTTQGPIHFEQMSAMAHPSDDLLPFETPWDASTATSVCSEADARRAITAPTHDVYAGYVARDIAGLDEIQLTFAGSAAATLTLYDFAKGAAPRETVVDLSQTRVITLPSAAPTFPGVGLLSALGGITFLGIAFTGLRRKLRPA